MISLFPDILIWHTEWICGNKKQKLWKYFRQSSNTRFKPNCHKFVYINSIKNESKLLCPVIRK